MLGAAAYPAPAAASHKGRHRIAHAIVLPALPKPDRPQLVIDAANGAVLHAQEARTPWHPASLTKLMTTYVALQAVRAGRIRFDAPLTVSATAAQQKPSKMGFAPGTVVTLDAALYMMLVKSANDMAVAIAEGVSGSIPAFVDEMNATSARLGLSDSVWRNPNGLPDNTQVTTARDLAMLMRALFRDFPDYQGFLRAPAIQIGQSIIMNHNPLIGRFAGADGGKTGYICDAGFNMVASASRFGERHIAVVLGADSARARTEWAALLLEKSFTHGAAKPAVQTVDSLQRSPNFLLGAISMKDHVCGRFRRRGSDMEEVESEIAAFAPTGNVGMANAGLLEMARVQAANEAAAGGRVSLLGPRPMNIQPIVIAFDPGNPRQSIPMRVALAGTSLPPLPENMPKTFLAQPLQTVPVVLPPPPLARPETLSGKGDKLGFSEPKSLQQIPSLYQRARLKAAEAKIVPVAANLKLKKEKHHRRQQATAVGNK